MSRRLTPDPRRPPSAAKLVPPKVDPDSLPPDYYALLSLVFGLLSFTLKVGVPFARPNARELATPTRPAPRSTKCARGSRSLPASRRWRP